MILIVNLKNGEGKFVFYGRDIHTVAAIDLKI